MDLNIHFTGLTLYILVLFLLLPPASCLELTSACFSWEMFTAGQRLCLLCLRLRAESEGGDPLPPPSLCTTYLSAVHCGRTTSSQIQQIETTSPFWLKVHSYPGRVGFQSTPETCCCVSTQRLAYLWVLPSCGPRGMRLL